MRTSLLRSLTFCVALSLAAGCHAQGSSGDKTIQLTPALSRKIEVMVRSQFDVPPNMNVALGALNKSLYPGYQTLPITFSGGGQRKTIDFLLSNDGNTLARLETFDIGHSDAEAIPIQGRPIRGNPAAKVTIVNFDDLECPYCAQMHALLFPETADRYKGLVRFVYKDFPLVEIHPWAMHAAVDADCLAAQSGPAYWNFVDYVHAHAREITGTAHDVKASFAMLDRLSHEEGVRSHLDLIKLDVCASKQDQATALASIKQGEALGVNGTPTIFINGERISGVLPIQMLRLAIDRALKDAGVQPPPAAAAGATAPAARQPATK